MKRIIISATLCMLVGFSFAQKKAVKDAKSSMNSKKFEEARGYIKPALTDPETANDQETWKLAGDIEYKQFDEELQKDMTSSLTGKKGDQKTMYQGLFNSYAPYLKADELGELPDEKGKVKNKVRKDISNNIRSAYPYFRNGGAIAYEQKDYKKAVDFFEMYWNIPNLPIFADDKTSKDYFATQDTSLQEVKYFAAISAMYNKDEKKALELFTRITKEPFVENSMYKLNEVYELIAEQYRNMEDTVAFIQALQDGAKKFPQSTYFIPNLINEYIKNNELEKALAYLDEAIKNDPANACDFNSVKASIYSNKLDLVNAEKFYNEALIADPTCKRALEGLARTYILTAQDLKDKAYQETNRKTQTEIDAKAKEYYQKAYPLLEKYKGLLEPAASSDMRQALILLSNVYYNLNMSAEYDKTEAERKQYFPETETE